MLIEQIRLATTENHELLEKALFPYLNQIQHQNDYALLLQAFYGYLHPVEELITKNIDRALMPDMDRRRSSARILDDLKIIGHPETPDIAFMLPAITNSPQAFGALYVLEGSTLGGKIIAKTISETLGITEGCLFLKAMVQKPAPCGRLFCSTLNMNKTINKTKR